ncbi:MAG: SRPBCC family protein [Candidatus Hydrogenedentales bacterium]
MSQTQLHVAIAAAPEEVWPWLVEPERMVQWMQPLQMVELETPPPLDGGSRYRFVAPYGNRVHTFHGEVLAYDPFARFGIRLGGGAFSDGVTATAIFSLAAAGAATRVDLSIRVDGLHGLRRLAAPVGLGIARREVLLRLDTLKRILETSAA